MNGGRLPVGIAIAGHDPDVAVHDWIAVVLKLNGQRRRGLLLAAAGFGGNLAVPMNRNAAVQHGEAGAGRLGLAVVSKLGRRGPNVVRLPGEGRPSPRLLRARLAI